MRGNRSAWTFCLFISWGACVESCWIWMNLWSPRFFIICKSIKSPFDLCYWRQFRSNIFRWYIRFKEEIIFSTWLERNSWCHISRFVCFKSNWRLALFVAFGRSSKIIKISWDCSTSSTNPTSAVVFTGLRTGLGLIHSYISYLNENRWNNQRFRFFVFYSFESQWRFTMQTSRIYVSAFGYKFDLFEVMMERTHLLHIPQTVANIPNF